MTDDTAAPQSTDAGERLRRLQHLGVHRGRAGFITAQNPAAAPSNAGPSPASGQRTPSQSPDSSGALQPSVTPRLEDRVAAVEVHTPFGACLVAEARLPAGEQRGLPLAAAVAASGQAIAACARDPGLASFDLRRAAFLDTETSGLAGGTGTFAFMVGIGMFEISGGELAYVVRQVFMRSPAEEPALLDVTAALLARCDGIVTFNGRGFDAPLLATRYALRRQPSPLAGVPHFDLLPAARQRWRLRLPSCALGALERDILDHNRSQEDVPGWLIPSLYSDYARGLASGALSPTTVDDMARVFYHNREDIVSMVPLSALLCWPFEDNGNGWLQQPIDPIDAVSLGRCFEELGWHAMGELAYRTALERSLPPEVRTVALSRLGWMLKRLDRRDEAAAVWEDWITSVSGPNPTPYEELAKHHEWQTNDLTAARTWTLWALHTARQLPSGQARDQALATLQHRLDRLERKLKALS
jgi:hypothetical protein